MHSSRTHSEAWQVPRFGWNPHHAVLDPWQSAGEAGVKGGCSSMFCFLVGLGMSLKHTRLKKSHVTSSRRLTLVAVAPSTTQNDNDARMKGTKNLRYFPSPVLSGGEEGIATR